MSAVVAGLDVRNQVGLEGSFDAVELAVEGRHWNFMGRSLVFGPTRGHWGVVDQGTDEDFVGLLSECLPLAEELAPFVERGQNRRRVGVKEDHVHGQRVREGIMRCAKLGVARLAG